MAFPAQMRNAAHPSAPDDHPLVVDGVTHRYGEVTALQDVSLAIERGAFVTLLGPSGCGKTTLLRIIAGFLTPSAGRLLLGGQDITGVPPHKRPVNMVFQRPMLFPHLDVAGNVAFGLKVARVRRAEIARRVQDALAVVRLDSFSERMVDELSGGQMQRVALARALVNQPKVLLLDEPLSALDLKIRLEMEFELRRIHRETGATFVYVTHDQREALALSDRIAVFDKGRVDQVDAPRAVYREPASPFAAGFVGDSNVLPAEVKDGRMVVAGHDVSDHPDAPQGDGAVWLVVRPELARLLPEGDQRGGIGIEGVVVDAAYRGSAFTYRVRLDGLEQLFKAEVPDTRLEQQFQVGDRVAVTWYGERSQVLPREGTV